MLGSIGVSGNNGSAELTAGNKTEPRLSIGNNYGSWSYVYPSYMKSNEFRNSSLKKLKKNIEKLDIKATDLIKNTDICTYNFKTENDNNKKHIGLIIGEGYNCPIEIMSEDEQSIEQYSMTSVAWKAIQELTKEIDDLKKRLEEK